MGDFYRLKSGTHQIGTTDPEKGTVARIYRSNDPLNNIVESDTDLVAEEPQRWERLAAAPMQSGQGQPPPAYSAPPPPPSDVDRAMASLSGPMSVEEKRSRAEILRQQADMLEKQAEESDAAMKKAAKENPAPPRPPAGAHKDQTAADLQGMTKAQLHEVADREGAECPKTATKDELVKAIEKARKGGD